MRERGFDDGGLPDEDELEGRVVLRQKAITAPSGVRSDLDVIADLAARLDSPVAFATEPEEVFAELGRASEGGPADYSAITYDRIRDEGGVFWGGSAGNNILVGGEGAATD